jgi:NADH-quinone oxidoreductase subunit E
MNIKVESFSFNDDNLKKGKAIISNYPEGRERSALLPLLDLAQRQCGGWLPHVALEYVAEFLNLPFIRVYEVATFYSMFHLSPVGKHHIQICGTTPCWLRGSSDIMSTCEEKLKIKCGDVTTDAKFSLSEVECLGACVNAPVVQINDEYYENLTPEMMKDLIDERRYRK